LTENVFTLILTLTSILFLTHKTYSRKRNDVIFRASVQITRVTNTVHMKFEHSTKNSSLQIFQHYMKNSSLQVFEHFVKNSILQVFEYSMPASFTKYHMLCSVVVSLMVFKIFNVKLSSKTSGTTCKPCITSNLIRNQLLGVFTCQENKLTCEMLSAGAFVSVRGKCKLFPFTKNIIYRSKQKVVNNNIKSN